MLILIEQVKSRNMVLCKERKIMKYRIVDADNRASYSKPMRFTEVKAWFEPNVDLDEEHSKWAEIEDIDDMREYLVWEAQGMRPNYRIEDYPE